MEKGAQSIRLVTANLQHCAAGVGTAGHPRDLLIPAGQELAALHPDVVALSEVDYLQPRSGWTDQARRLAAACGLPYVRFAASYSGPVVGPRIPALRSNRPLFGGYGIALASRWPVRRWRTLRLRYPGIGFIGGGMRLRRFSLQRWLVNRVRIIQPRVALMGEIVLPGCGPLRVMAAHLTADSRSEARAEVARCAEVLAEGLHGAEAKGHSGEIGIEYVLTGDLNQDAEDLVQAGVADMGLRELGEIATFPAHDPGIQLDHVLASPGVVLTRPQRTVRLSISDHQVLISDIALSDRCEGIRSSDGQRD